MGGGEKPIALYELLFDYQISICDRFHISPFQLRRERFSEFLLLAKRLRKQTKNEKKKDKNGKVKNFVPVTDYKL